jgi:branched-chain amino acid transport system permease protein
MLSNLLVQLVNGLADASTLFLVAAGLSLIFGVTRIVNFAHGSFYMFGIYVAYSIASRFGHTAGGFWLSVLAAALVVAVLGALVEMVVLRRIYQAPELFHLLATFGLVLIFRDAALWLWGPEDLFGPRAPHLAGAVDFLGHPLPTYDIALIVIGPVVLLLLWYALTRTRWGTLVRAATQDREMLGALGINQAWLFTGVFFVGAFLAGLGGALQGPRMSANLSLDLETIGNAFVVVVVGGMGSIPGAFIAALIIAEIKALCIGIGHVTIFGVGLSLSRFTLVAEFVVMAVVLVVRPWGLLGRASAAVRGMAAPETPLRPAGKRLKWLATIALLVLVLAPLAANAFPYMPVLLVEILIAVLFATSLHFIMGPGGMHSFGHAAYFGLGAYGAALFLKVLNLPMEAALLLGPLLAVAGALVFGWFCVRLSGVYLAMLTLAFAQIVWSVVFQWDDVTGGSNGILGLWPSNWLSSPVALLRDARLRRDRRVAVAQDAVLAAGLRDACVARFGAARRGDRHRREARAMGRVRDCIAVLRARRIVVCVLQGHDFAGSNQREPFRGRPRDGAARRLADAHRADRGRGCVHVVARHGRAPDRLLAGAAGLRDPAAGDCVSAGNRRLHSRAFRRR